MGMLFYLLSKIGSSIPRGFSRRYILQFIKQHPIMTAKEIVDMAIEQSEGKWKPSPGYIYPMIWKLLAKGLISEVDNGRYSLTKQGMKLLSDIEWAYNLLEKKEYVIPRIKNIGKSIADALSIPGSIFIARIH
jgi:DNA-binding PadR family transcriptional regulator